MQCITDISLQNSAIAFTRHCGWLNIFPCTALLFSKRNYENLSLFYFYFHGKCSHVLISVVPCVQIFRAKIRHAMYTATNNLHFLRISSIKKLLTADRFFREGASPMATILTSSCIESIVISSVHFQNMHFLNPPLIFIHQHHLDFWFVICI